MKHFCIIANQTKDENRVYTNEIASYLTEHGCSAFVTAPIVPEENNAKIAEGIPKETECAIVLGGDGTFLHAAKVLEHLSIPVLGINLGNLGFLMTTEPSSASSVLEMLLRDDCYIEERMLVSATMKRKSGPNATAPKWYAMNDVVITRSGFSRLIHLQVFVDEQLVSDYQSDGVIISTPTGSTGYSLSAGGPLVSPTVKMLLITPICPHALGVRPLAVSDESKIAVRILAGTRSRIEEAVVTVDGDEMGNLAVGDELVILKSERTIPMVMLREVTFWDRVKGKL